jgi:predicted SprT family Zn-dependent metalloprotease
MKNINAIYNEALDIVIDSIGAENLGQIVLPIVINTRAMKRWGRCITRNGYSTIEISSRILGDDVPDNAVLSTMVHEILHSCKNGHSHTGMWKIYANKVNRKYPYLNIQRTKSANEFGLSQEQVLISQKYAIRCKNCGAMHYSSRMSASIQTPEKYGCKRCGGKNCWERIK